MPIHHPTALTLERYAERALAPGAALVTEFHLAGCPSCAEVVTARNDLGESTPYAPTAPTPAHWRWAGPGVRIAQCSAAAGISEYLYLVQARAGAKLPRHAHTGSEWVVVLEGAYLDEGMRFERGDLSEHTGAAWHTPQASKDSSCVCLVAAEGPLRFQGLTRLMQPWLGV